MGILFAFKKGLMLEVFKIMLQNFLFAVENLNH